jgi:hypothetical protein
MTVQPLPVSAALDRYFLEVRCKLLDVAAALDRIDRGGDPPDDPRLQRIHHALQVLCEKGPGRAEHVQRIFSLDYDPGWQRPQPQAASPTA